MPLPHWIARFNKRWTNRFLEPVVARFSGFAVIHHRGRRSGRPYTTPVNVFEGDSGAVIVALTYGTGADWVKNVLAGGGAIERRGELTPFPAPTVVGRDEAWRFVPWFVQIALRILTVQHFLRIATVD
ncbi:MAG TPA: nitroreductase family deazaflavin-dependent oxidoreductase [Acidimicrobiia bacterium]|nr:nitroreductase family deazaflavin-dependent oxidoreductase [Acidimicrobiia bacterium]